MNPDIYYENHLGEAVRLYGGGVYAHASTLDDWRAEYALFGGRAARFSREAVEASLPVTIAAATPEDGFSIRNRLFEVAEKDVLAKIPGRLFYDGWYVSCYVVASGKDLHWYSGRTAEVGLTLLLDAPMWTREHLQTFTKASASGGMNYPHAFPFDFGASSLSKVVDNPGFAAAPAKLTVYGPADGPRIAIGGNAYAADATVPAGGRLEIDGLNKTVTVYDAYGNAQNAFHTRRGTQRKGSGSYAFEHVPAGSNAVTWDGSFAFDVTLYEQRAERRWGT